MSAHDPERPVSIVTGAAKGIGAAVVGALARRGSRILAVDVDSSQLARTVDELRAEYGDVDIAPCQADLTSMEQTSTIVPAALDAFGRVDVLVNNAAMTLPRTLEQTSFEEYELVFNLNCRSVFQLMNDVYEPMIAAGGGSIVNVSSGNALIGRPGFAVYAAAKAAVVSLTKSAAVGWGEHGIRVNAVCPGSIDTPMFRSSVGTGAAAERSVRATSVVTPLRRIGQPEEVASAIEYFASPESRYVTGQVLSVDGGRMVGIAEAAHVLFDPREL